MNSAKKTTRIAGILYLVIFIASPVAFLIGKGGLLVPGDATATANNIMASETLFRTGIAAETVVFLVEIVMAAIFYVLLKPVSPILSLGAAFARIAEAVVQAVNLIPSILIFLISSGSAYLSVFAPEQLDAIMLLSLDLYGYVTLVWGFFFGLHLLLLGYLVYQSGYFPKIIGGLLVIAAFGYFLQSYGVFLVPQYKELLDAIVMVAAVPGELAFTVYLLWKGMNFEKWEKRSLAYA
jgi:hypothetical protein